MTSYRFLSLSVLQNWCAEFIYLFSGTLYIVLELIIQKRDLPFRGIEFCQFSGEFGNEGSGVDVMKLFTFVIYKCS
jgi:hypothetical protein